MSMSASQSRRNFSGHLGRLSQNQEAALEKFKAGLEKAGLYTPPTETTEASHDDATLMCVSSSAYSHMPLADMLLVLQADS